MKCAVCGKEYNKGEGFKGGKYKSLHFCSQDCFERYCKIKSAPKPPVNYKPQPNTDRRKYTDYIQDWTGDNVNWAYIMKQSKDIQEEYELNFHDMFLVLKYCREYEQLEWNYDWGLYQFFPKYILYMRNFQKSLKENKELAANFDFSDDTYIVNRKENQRRKWHENYNINKEEGEW